MMLQYTQVVQYTLMNLYRNNLFKELKSVQDSNTRYVAQYNKQKTSNKKCYEKQGITLTPNKYWGMSPALYSTIVITEKKYCFTLFC